MSPSEKSAAAGLSSPKPTAIIIGAGVGGVSTAARLAKAGFQVTVLEKNHFTGGRCSLLYSDDDPATSTATIKIPCPPIPTNAATPSRYRFDQGPSLLLLPNLFHQTFADLSTSLVAEDVHLIKCEPNYKVHFADREIFTLSTDLALMKREIEKWEGKAGFERYLAYLAESHAHYELSVREVLLRNFEGVAAMFRWEFLQHLLRLHPFESIWARCGKYFWSERLRRVFTFGSMYMGMSPFDAPGTYSLLQYTELAEGIWYPIGGFHRVIDALVKVGEREGVEYRLNTGVKKILLDADGSRARGVELENGEKVFADVVVNNSDLVYAYSTLLPESGYAESLKERPGSCSSISFYWGLDRQVPELEAHNIFLAEHYKESFDSIFKKHLIPDEPSFYVNVPSRVDPTAAPPDTDSVVVLVPVGHLIDPPASADAPALAPTPTQDWPAMVALARRTILSTIAARTGVDLTPHIVHEQTNDPATWRDGFHLDRGAILGLSHSFFNVLCFRPSTRARRPGFLDARLRRWGVLGRAGEVLLDAWRDVRGTRDVRGLYMVGASAHPGTGVPICLAGGKLVAEQICGDYGVEVPWRKVDVKRVRGGGDAGGLDLDRIERPVWLDSWEQWMGIFGGLVVVVMVMIMMMVR